MSRIRQHVVGRFMEELDQTVFTRHSFAVKMREEEKGDYDVRIFLLDYPEYVMKLTFQGENAEDDPWYIVMSPGAVLMEDEYDVDGISEVLAQIRIWTSRILEELRHRATEEEAISRFREELNSAIQDLPEPQRPFTAHEADLWRTRLDQAFSDLKSIKEQLEVTDQEMTALKKQIDELKQFATSLPKKVWIRSAGSAFSSFFERASTKVITAVTEGTIKALLPPAS